MNKTALPEMIEFGKIGEESIGYLTVAEVNDQLPFEVKRVYWVYKTPEEVKRGGHANKTNHQVVVAVNGKADVRLTDQQGGQMDFALDRPDAGLLIPPLYWRDFELSDQAVLLCMAAQKYDPADYIRDYNEFVKND